MEVRTGYCFAGPLTVRANCPEIFMFRAKSTLSTSILLGAIYLLVTVSSAAPAHASHVPSVIAIDRSTVDAVELRNWSPLSTVTVEVWSGPSGSMLVPPTPVLVDENGFAFIPLPIAFAAGQVVRASLALVIREVTLTPLTVEADATADLVSGSTSTASAVNVEVCYLGACSAVPVTPDASGRFVVSAAGLPPSVSNIRLGTTFSATIVEPDGDGQRVEGSVSPTVSAIGGAVVLNGWPGGPTPTITIQVFASPGGALLFASPLVPADGAGFIQMGVGPLLPGQLVRASDGVTTKDLTIVPLSVQGNTATDVLSGNAPSNAVVTVQAHCGPVTNLCAVTRLITADESGEFSTSLAPVVDIGGGSDLSASVSDVDGDRQYATVGQVVLDVDRDGIANLIDVQPTIVSTAFDEAPTGLTAGRVLSDGGLMVAVADAVPPSGVTVSAIGGGPLAVAQVEVCAPPLAVWRIDLTADDRVTLTCGSLTARVLSGPVTIRVPGSPASISVPSGSTAKLSILATGEAQVENIAGGEAIGVTVGNVATLVAAGGSYVIPTLPTGTDQCRDGGWKSFPIFKSQGDCVSFIATKGKNGPAR